MKLLLIFVIGLLASSLSHIFSEWKKHGQVNIRSARHRRKTK